MPETLFPIAMSAAILDSLIEEVAIIDASGKIVFVNEAWKEFAKTNDAAMERVAEGVNYLDVLRESGRTDSDAARALAGIESVLAGSRESFVHEYMCSRGSETRWFAQRVSPLRGDADGAVIAHVDVTDRKLVEQERESHRFELGRAVRAATLGQLSGALAHELNQPLSAILTNVQVGILMSERNGSPAEIAEILTDIERSARRAGQIIERIRRMLQRRDTKLEPVNLNAVVEETLILCQGELVTRGVELVKDLATDIPELRGDPIALQHVLLNLIVNAYEAMAEPSGKHCVLGIRTEAKRHGRVVLTVTDTGTGFQEESLRKVFRPLYTTKKGGLGLGLSICRSIVDAHGGGMTISSAETGGAKVTVVLPAGQRRDRIEEDEVELVEARNGS